MQQTSLYLGLLGGGWLLALPRQGASSVRLRCLESEQPCWWDLQPGAEMWEHFLREVPDAPTAVPGQGAASLSPSASFLQAMLYVGSASRVVEVPMAMCGLYRNNCESCLLARDPYCGWAGGRCQAVHQNPYVALSSPLSQEVPSPFPFLAPFPFPAPFPFLRVVLGTFCHQRQVPSCPGSTSTQL